MSKENFQLLTRGQEVLKGSFRSVQVEGGGCVHNSQLWQSSWCWSFCNLISVILIVLSTINPQLYSYCSWGSQGKNTEVVCHSLLQRTTFCQTSPPWPACLGWPHTAWLSFIELDKAVVHVIRLASCLWLWFQSVCPLMPSLSAYHLTWVSLTLDVGVSLQGCSSKAQPLLLTLDVGYLLLAAAPDHGCGCGYDWW